MYNRKQRHIPDHFIGGYSFHAIESGHLRSAEPAASECRLVCLKLLVFGFSMAEKTCNWYVPLFIRKNSIHRYFPPFSPFLIDNDNQYDMIVNDEKRK